MYAIRSYYANDTFDFRRVLTHVQLGHHDLVTEAFADLADRGFRARPHVITSYSIHYTKLYDEPGQFYKRELPCILELLKQVNPLPNYIVIDGYVYLGGDEKPGLGKHRITSYNVCYTKLLRGRIHQTLEYKTTYRPKVQILNLDKRRWI